MFREAGSKPRVAVPVTFDEVAHAEVRFQLKQALSDETRLFNFSRSCEAGGEKPQIGRVNRVFRVGSASPGNRLLVIALSIGGEPERAMRKKDVGLKRREAQCLLGSTARLDRIAD